MPRTKTEKKSTKYLKVKKGSGKFLIMKINRKEMPTIDRMLKAESRIALKQEFGITLPDDVDWPTSKGRYSDRLKVLLQFIEKEGQKNLKYEDVKGGSCEEVSL